ncbi:M1 family metallopeptidase [Weeksellaceae bacterium KMM 9713]|uniref:M1 family metallopeptidase n=1 Tax=Profundicola chukchiensis TaxID=2961959 RepID=A0A9X4MXV6_9FLAO|nr:M1 family metallopeptidase [Profundicola chukchiensis]MDG4945532.1 M1 family metallopeptidase [Profundicola chukchiensis]
MNRIWCLILSFLMLSVYAQEDKNKGHYDESPFKQLKEELPTPNMFRTASGAPGPAYYQQQADYKMSIRLDEEKDVIYGDETITYTNNSPDTLEYLWVQLDQNMRAADSPTKMLYESKADTRPMTIETYSKRYREGAFDGGFKLELLQDANGKDMQFIINQTMMRIDLEKPLAPTEKISFRIKWNYNINNYRKEGEGGRSGFELMEDGNKIYVIAQFFPRMAVYNDVEGWQNMQFWGRSEFALPFGTYDVSITVPDDHVLNATGKLMNEKEVLSSKQYQRMQQAWKSYDKPVMIVNEAEATKAEKSRSKKMKTWKFFADNVRDFAFSSSRKFIWDAMAVKLNDKDVIAMSLYPREANPLWEEYSTRTVAHTLKEYSNLTFDYPYHKAISVSAEDQGMEYPMICWNFGRPTKGGYVSDRTKYGMIAVIIHEIGHNFFPMIVNSDERQWTWMDEGLNTFLQYTTEQNFKKSFPNEVFPEGFDSFPSRRGAPKDIVEYMSMPQKVLEPIMTQGDHVHNFGANAYGKPGTALVVLRNTVMGKELFDHAFRTYANRWKFKHPTPADFFRTMEDASAMDLDWFWRGWFYTTWYVDMGIEKVTPYYLQKTQVNGENRLQFVEKSNEIDPAEFKKLKELKQLDSKMDPKVRKDLKNPTYFYEVVYNRPGKLIMPLLVTFEFEDGTTEEVRYPYMMWRLNDETFTKFYEFDKPVKKITIDAKQETADIDISNNVWTVM